MKKMGSNLMSVAKQNTSVSVNKEEVKKGMPLKKKLSSAPKFSTNYGQLVGISLGATVNMGDFQSLRVDVWLNDTVQDGEKIEDAYQRIKNVCRKVLSDTMTEMQE